MVHTFDEAVVTAVLGHMNGDHSDDNLLIARAFGGDPQASGSIMSGFDGEGAEWDVAGSDGASTALRVAWLNGPISERAEVRREIVALYDEACRRLDIEPRPHD